MVKQEKTEPFAVIPVTGLYRVYEENGKQFKSRIYALVFYKDSSEDIDIETLDLVDIREGYYLKGGPPKNVIGIVDDGNNFVELSPADYLKK